VNSRYHDKAAFLSFDGLTLYFSRDMGWQYAHIYAAARETPDGLFGEPWEVSELNLANGHVDYPWVSPDNLRMYFYSTEGGWRRLKVSRRSSVTGWWRTPMAIPELNGLGEVANPSLTEDELTIVFSGLSLEKGRGSWDLWTASRPDRESLFSHVANLGAVNGASSDMHPYISPDGLTLYFASNRNGTFQIFTSTRLSLDSPFEPPEHIAALDTPDGESQYPRLSADGNTFFYARWKKNEMADIYISHRVDGSVCGVKLVCGGDPGANPWGSPIFATVQEAVGAAKDGDVVRLHPGVYREEISFRGKAITIESAGDAAILEAPEGAAVSFSSREGAQSVLRNVIIRNSHIGIWLADSSPTIANVTVAGNVLGVEAYGKADPAISNSIFWGNSQSDLYGCVATYSCIERGAPGEGNFRNDPLFVDPENGDYHLRSERGRYWPEHDVWVLDKATSPCIDAGDPAADFSCEPEPNGGRLNVGAHGGTACAEMSEAHAR
jgi:hypothetical protein